MELERYIEKVVTPARLKALLLMLDPDQLKRTITERTDKHVEKGEVFQMMVLPPNPVDIGKLTGKDFNMVLNLVGKSIDMRPLYAEKFNLTFRHGSLGPRAFIYGSVATKQELLEILFGRDTSSSDSDQSETAIQVYDPFDNATHRTIFINCRDFCEFDDIREAAQRIIEGYRGFDESQDGDKFKFPEGYTPLAVEKEEELYALGYRETRDGIELYLQLANEVIAEQIRQAKERIGTEIEDLRKQIQALEARRWKLAELEDQYS